MKNLLLTTILLTIGVSAYSQQFVKNTFTHHTPDGFTKYKDLTTPEEKKAWKDELVKELWDVNEFNIYGGGALLGLLTGDEKVEDATNVGGSVGFNFATDFMSTNLFFSYNGAARVEMNSLSQLGVSLNNPNSSGQSASIDITSKLLRRSDRFGLHTRLSIVNNLWQIDSTEINATPIEYKFGLYFKPWSFDMMNDTLDLAITVSYAHRNILGDFGNADSFEIEGTTIKQRGYNGIDVALNLVFNRVELYALYSYNAKLKNAPVIPGFTGSQFTVGINLAAELIKLKPKKKQQQQN